MKHTSGTKHTKNLIFWAFLLPSLFFYVIFFMIPLVGDFVLSLTSWNGLDQNITMVGFSNYIKILTDDPGFYNSLRVTAIYAICYVVTLNIFALLLALLFEHKVVGGGIFKGIIFLPNATSLIIVAFVWQFLFTGVYKDLVQNIPIDFLHFSWFEKPGTSMLAIIIAQLWNGAGYTMLIYLAGLTAINPEYLEAAAIDGAGWWKKLRMIKLPLLMPSITINLFITIANGFKSFELAFKMTQGGPGKSTEFVALNIYREAFTQNQLGYASAKAFVLFLIILLITYFQLKATKSKEVQF